MSLFAARRDNSENTTCLTSITACFFKALMMMKNNKQAFDHATEMQHYRMDARMLLPSTRGIAYHGMSVVQDDVSCRDRA